MSNYELNNVKMVDKTLVEKILEQGQKLRNSMVESILKNDPLYNMEVIYDKHFNSPKSSACDLLEAPQKDYNFSYTSDSKRLEAFVRGEYLTKDEERLALESVRSMSAPDVCRTTDRALCKTDRTLCKCYTCAAYDVNNLKCDLRRTVKDSDITSNIQNRYKNQYSQYFKHIDSMKVTIYNIVLNDIGTQKAFFSDSSKIPYAIGQNYFIEYQVPDLIRGSFRNKSKVDSGLDNNHIKLCSRGNNEVINVKQTFIHDVINLDQVAMAHCEIIFKISFRNPKSKTASVLGYAKFCFKDFEISKNLTCIRGISIHLTECSPIIVGMLKIQLQLGCGRSYFGKEFIDAIATSTKHDSVTLNKDDICSDQLNFESKPLSATSNISIKNLLDTSKQNKEKKASKEVKKSVMIENNNINPIETKFISPNEVTLKNQIKDTEKQIIFGFLYISEAQYFTGAKSTYLTSRPFLQEETSISRLVLKSSNPVFMFFQNIPLIYEDDLLSQLRENYMVVEFWEKTESSDVVFGLAKIDLHQFYLAYRNPVISKHLRGNKLPIIGSDWWEPIYNLSDEELLGQVQILTALGTEDQIEQLKLERGFKSNVVKAKFPIVQKENSKTNSINNSNYFKDRLKINNHTNKTIVNKSSLPCKDSSNIKSKEVSVGVQAEEIKMEPKEESKKVSPTQEMIGSFLDQLLSLRQKNVYVENSTNTDNTPSKEVNNEKTEIQSTNNPNVNLKKTSDLLDTLQTALAAETNQKINNVSNHFKTLISINSANQLPSRKKFKSKKIRGRSSKHEENILPSTYVTFETVPNSNLNITPIVPRSTTPKWDYKCEVYLPLDLLNNDIQVSDDLILNFPVPELKLSAILTENYFTGLKLGQQITKNYSRQASNVLSQLQPFCHSNQKRLIFKVWKKSSNTAMQPNLQTDTVLGFAALDLTVLLAGLPSVQGWFNIIDFSGKCNGQINVHVTPLENLTQFQRNSSVLQENTTVPPQKISSTDEPGELLSRALKRKFTELDEITQRLRLRLSEVTTEDSDGSNDDLAEEFEQDINTLCVEDDFDLINFEEEARKFNQNYNKTIENRNETHLVSIASAGTDTQTNNCNIDIEENRKSEPSSSSSNAELQKELFLDEQLMQGKQRIDTLLEKLTLISSDASNIFSSRYVSGCSVTTENVDTEAILKDLDHFSRPNIQGVNSFDPVSFQQIYGGSMYCPSDNSEDKTSSETSIKTDYSECRPTPDGEGNSGEDKK